MSGTFIIKRGDTRPVLRLELTSAAAPIDLTTATSVQIFFKQAAAEAIERAGVIESPATAGVVTYTFVDADWASGGFAIGKGSLEVEVTLAAGDVLTVPTKGYGDFIVTTDLGD